MLLASFEKHELLKTSLEVQYKSGGTGPGAPGPASVCMGATGRLGDPCSTLS